MTVPHLRSPVGLSPSQLAITQGFNAPVDYSRLNPRRRQAHEGIDFAPRGNARNQANIPVLAVQNGTVTRVSRQQGGYGNYIQLRFDDGRYGALYAHLDSVNVQAGDHVSEGQPLGTMGSSGNSTGRHLHFNLLDLQAGRGNYIYPQVIDPTPFLELGSTLLQRVNDQPVRNIGDNQYRRQAVQSTKSRIKPERLLSIPSPRQQSEVYPPNMPAGTEVRAIPVTQEYAPSQDLRSIWNFGMPPMFQTDEVTEPTLGIYSPESVVSSVQGVPNAVGSAIAQGLFAQGLQPDGTFDLLQAVTGMSGDEREQYIQDKAPYIVLAIVMMLLFVLGAVRLVFAPKP